MQNQVNQSDIDRFFTIDVILLSTFIFFQLFFREIYESMPSITLSISGILNVGICIYLFIFPFLIKKFRKEQNWRFSAALTRTFCLLPLTLGNMSFVRQALGTNMLLYSFIGISIFGLIFMTGEIVSRKNAFKFLRVQ